MFECLLCKEKGIKYEKKNIVPHIKNEHPEIDGDTKVYKKMFPEAKMRVAPKTNFSNKDHILKAIEKSVKSRTGKHLSDEHRNKIGNSNKNSEKYKEGVKRRSERYKTGEMIHHHKLTEEKISIPKEELINLYCKEKMSLNELGRKFDKTGKTIKKYLHFYGIETRDRYTSQMLVLTKGEEFKKLPDLEKEILEGELLGDGCLNIDEGKGITPIYRHSCKHAEYVLWLRTIFRSFRWSDAGIVSSYNKKAERSYYGINSKIHPEFKEFYERFYYYDNIKNEMCKKIPDDLVLTHTKLLHWFLGDGCLCREKKRTNIWHIEMATQGFKIDKLEKIIKPQLTKMGINCKVKKTKAGPSLKIYAESFERFFDLIGAKSPVKCYDYKFKIVEEKFPHLLKTKEIEINSESKEECVNAYFDFYKEKGFQFPHLYYEQRMSILEKVQESDSKNIIINEDVMKISKVGMRLANFYHPHMYTICSSGSKKSVIDLFNDDNVLKEKIEILYDKYGKVRSGDIRSILSIGSTYKPFNFRPLIAKYIVENYSKDEDIILDPCSGYGGRLLGCMSVKNRIYHGVEPETATYNGLNQMSKDLGFEDRVNIQKTNFEDAEFDSMNKFGLIFTCPPYYNKELYGPGNKKQSHVMYKTYEEWKAGFLSVLVSRSYNLLKDDGYFCIVINNIMGYPLADDFEEMASKFFKLEKKYKIQYNNNPFELKRTGEKFKYEPLFIFKKGV